MLRLIRKDSETPNVTSHDDARMVRYAYGGQDGFVKNRGSEIGYTINGTSFVIGSGVLVLQGWEVEIDANGVSVPISGSVSGRQYYSVYLEVNCGTDTASIKSIYTTIAYPNIPASDDLTKDTTGAARLLLYRFMVASGVISGVQKIVEGIDYTKDSVSALRNDLNSTESELREELNEKVEGLENDLQAGDVIPANAKKVNDLEIKRDTNGVLKIGDTIIPQKIPLWSGSQECSFDAPVTYNFSRSLLIRREIEIKGLVTDALIGGSPSVVSFRLYIFANSDRCWVNAYGASNNGETKYDLMVLGNYEFIYGNNGYNAIKLYGVKAYNGQDKHDYKDLAMTVTDIYEVLE